jgi:hypothetical protein
MHAMGVPDSVVGYFMNLKGDGDLDPRIAQQSLDSAYAYVNSRMGVANQYNQANGAFAQRHGMDPRDIAADLGQAPAPYSVPGQVSSYAPKPTAAPGVGRPGPAPQANAVQVLAQAQQAIARGAPRAAVIARVQRMGLNPAGL